MKATQINKPDIINMMAEQSGYTKIATTENLDALLAVITHCAENGIKFNIHNHFSLEVIERNEKNGTNPITKEAIIIPASKTLKLKLGKSLKEAVRK